MESIDLDTNLDYLYAELLMSAGFKDEANVNVYMNNRISSPTAILDCTIRDGGYTNNWDFSDEYVTGLHSLMADIGVDYFEIGFRNNLQHEGRGKWYCVTDAEICRLFASDAARNNLRKCKIAMMVTLGRFSLDAFDEAAKSPVSLVRVLLHREKNHYQIEEG